ncbi:MAG: ferredoxin [Angustibacter sp.]
MSQQLMVDRQRCAAHGLCHELVPEIVDLDEWGYPVVTGPVGARLVDLARRAVSACPVLALRVEGPDARQPRRSGVNGGAVAGTAPTSEPRHGTGPLPALPVPSALPLASATSAGPRIPDPVSPGPMLADPVPADPAASAQAKPFPLPLRMPMEQDVPWSDRASGPGLGPLLDAAVGPADEAPKAPVGDPQRSYPSRARQRAEERGRRRRRF